MISFTGHSELCMYHRKPSTLCLTSTAHCWRCYICIYLFFYLLQLISYNHQLQSLCFQKIFIFANSQSPETSPQLHQDNVTYCLKHWRRLCFDWVEGFVLFSDKSSSLSKLIFLLLGVCSSRFSTQPNHQKKYQLSAFHFFLFLSCHNAVLILCLGLGRKKNKKATLCLSGCYLLWSPQKWKFL